jgi:hypothetical protein
MRCDSYCRAAENVSLMFGDQALSLRLAIGTVSPRRSSRRKPILG